MSDRKRKVLAILLIIAIIGGWYVTLFGIGKWVDPIKDQIKLGLDIKGGVYVVMEAQTDASGEELTKLMDQTKTVIENRVDQMGLTNPVVTREGDKRIRVELPGVEDAEQAIEMIGQTAQLQFALADGTLVLDGSSVKTATTSQDTQKGGYAVDLEFNADGANAFEQATATAIAGQVQPMVDGVSAKAIMIMLDNTIVSAPEVNEIISGGKCQITGGYTQEEATNTAALIRGGALPVQLTEVTSSIQTATIGVDAFEKSVMAGIIGVCMIFLIMLVGYRVMGLAANISLLLYIVLIIGVMALMGSVLTLPGIAGIVLSIGMAVDANVIIFSRIREEICAGRSVRVAVQTGFKRAMNTVVDSQVTTLIAAVILYQIGTSAVKGFAWTLMIGIFASIFTAVVVTQIFLGLFANSKRLSKKSFFGVKEDNKPAIEIKRQFNFIKHRKIYYIVSIVIILVGLGFAGLKGFNYGIDFTGGTMIHMDMGKAVSTKEVKTVLDKSDTKADIVFSGEGNKEVIIKTVDSLNNAERGAVIDSITKEFSLGEDALLSSEHFGPAVGKELRNNAILAVIISSIGMLIYIRFRFNQWKFGGAALLGVAHDVLLVIAFYAIFQITVNNPFIAGVLTVVGYSINDTIVVFDRIRENSRYAKTGDLEQMVDKSINQTLIRSIMTSFTTFVVMVPLYLMTSPAIREFTLPLMVGILVGCLSSIFVASPFYYEFSKLGTKTHYERVLLSEKRAKKKKEKEKEKKRAEKKAKDKTQV